MDEDEELEFSEEDSEKDERTLKILKKYFSFFKLHGYLPKKWKKHIIKHIDDFFKFRDQLKEEMEKKDSTLDALSIDEIISIIDKMAAAWEDTASQLDSILSQQETERKKLEDTFTSLYDSLEKILENQEKKNRVVAPILYFSAAETKSYADGTLTVETDTTQTSYADGVLTLPDYLGR